MASLFGAGIRANSGNMPSINARVQSSVQGRPIPIGMGQNRVAGNIIWYDDFKAIPASQPGGKGAGGSGKGYTGQYDYSASFMVSVGQTIAGIQSIINGNQINFLVTPSAAVLAALANIGIQPVYGNLYGETTILGSYSQTAWSYLVSNHSAAALAYRGEALACFPNLALQTTPTLPNFNFEVLWAKNTDVSAYGPDANPADWVTSFLSDADWGAGFPSALLGSIGDTGAATYGRWCRATGMLISPVLSDQTSGQSHLADIMKATISDFRWSSGKLDVVPYGDAAVTGNGYTYTPAVTPVYDLGLADYLAPQGSASFDKTPVNVSRVDPSQVPNRVYVQYVDRNNLYNPVTIHDDDEPLQVAAGCTRATDVRSYNFFCNGAAASISASLQLHRIKVFATYQWTLPSTFVLLDPMDIVTLTEPNLGLSKQPVRITEIVENADDTLSFTAEEYLGTVSSPLYARQTTLGTGRNTNVSAGNVNTPIIFEPLSQQSFNAEIWGAVSGSSPALYGGCEVWASYDSGGTYSLVDTVAGASRMGVLTALLPGIAANPNGQTVDNTNTLSVDLTESAAQLLSGSANDMTALNTACYCDGEIISYETATLTSAYHYGLAPMVRGAYGSAIGPHQIGSAFARLDNVLFRIPYTPDRIGKTVFLKFLSFNIYGGGMQALSDVSPYTYLIIGSNQDQKNILNILTGTGPGTLSNTISALNTKVSALAKAGTDQNYATRQVTGQALQQTRQNAAGIITEQTIRQTSDESVASQLITFVASLNDTIAGVTLETTARVAGDNALASTISTETVNRTNADAVITGQVTTEQSARITGDAANATAITNAIAAFNSNFANAQLRFDVLATDGSTYVTIAMMGAVGSGGTFIESGLRIFVSIVAGVPSSQMQLLTQNLIITDGVHTSSAFSFDATTGTLTLSALLFNSLKDLTQTHVSIAGSGNVTFSA